MKKQLGKITKVHNPLRKALYGPRRIGRDIAIRQADHNVAELREEFERGLKEEIVRISDLVDMAEEQLSDRALLSVVGSAAVIFNLAGALGYSTTQAAVAKLYDFIAVLSDRGLRCVEPLTLIAMAAKSAGPGMPKLSEKQAKDLLDHLDKILIHFRDHPSPCSKESGCTVCPSAAHCKDTATVSGTDVCGREPPLRRVRLNE